MKCSPKSLECEADLPMIGTVHAKQSTLDKLWKSERNIPFPQFPHRFLTFFHKCPIIFRALSIICSTSLPDVCSPFSPHFSKLSYRSSPPFLLSFPSIFPQLFPKVFHPFFSRFCISKTSATAQGNQVAQPIKPPPFPHLPLIFFGPTNTSANLI